MGDEDTAVERSTSGIGAAMFVSWLLFLGPVGLVLLLGVPYAMVVQDSGVRVSSVDCCWLLPSCCRRRGFRLPSSLFSGKRGRHRRHRIRSLRWKQSVQIEPALCR